MGVEKVSPRRNGVEANANGACSLGTNIVSQDCPSARALGVTEEVKAG